METIGVHIMLDFSAKSFVRDVATPTGTTLHPQQHAVALRAHECSEACPAHRTRTRASIERWIRRLTDVGPGNRVGQQ